MLALNTLLSLLRSRGRGIVISTHLCEEYARSATTDSDNIRNIYERALKIFVSVSLLALDLNRDARASRAF